MSHLQTQWMKNKHGFVIAAHWEWDTSTMASTNVRGEEGVPSWDGAAPVLLGYFCHKMDVCIK